MRNLHKPKLTQILSLNNSDKKTKFDNIISNFCYAINPWLILMNLKL